MKTSPFKRRAGAAALAILLACGAASPALAAGLALPGAQLELPFQYRVAEHLQTFANMDDLSVLDSYHLEVTAGEAVGEKILVQTRYVTIAPDRPGAVADKLKELAAADARKADTRESRLLRVDGFDFAFLDGAAEGDYSRRMVLRGAINGALYTVAVFARSDVTLTPELAQRLTSLHIDYATLLQMGSRLDEEGRLAVEGQRVTTPLGTLSLDKDIHARLIRSTRASGPDGRATFRRRTFELGREQGLFSGGKYMHMSVGCGAMSEWNYDGYIRMADRPKDNGKPRKLKSLEPATLAGFDGRKSLALEELSSIRRVAAEKDGTHFEVEIEHLNASRLADDLAGQLTAPAACERELVFVPDRGAAPPEGTASKE